MGKKKNKRDDFFSLIPANAEKILDVGCADASWIKRSGKNNLEVVGIEQNEKFYAEARKNLQRVIEGDVENLKLPYPEGYFDCIVYADLLEHLKDPYALLSGQKKYLNDDGCVIASIPNVRYYKVILRLIMGGAWDYMPSGILDNTHLRFFTLINIIELFENAGYRIVEIKRNRVAASGFKFLNFLMFNRLDEFLVYQYYIKAVKQKTGASFIRVQRKIFHF